MFMPWSRGFHSPRTLSSPRQQELAEIRGTDLMMPNTGSGILFYRRELEPSCLLGVFHQPMRHGLDRRWGFSARGGWIGEALGQRLMMRPVGPWADQRLDRYPASQGRHIPCAEIAVSASSVFGLAPVLPARRRSCRASVRAAACRSRLEPTSMATTRRLPLRHLQLAPFVAIARKPPPATGMMRDAFVGEIDLIGKSSGPCRRGPEAALPPWLLCPWPQSWPSPAPARFGPHARPASRARKRSFAARPRSWCELRRFFCKRSFAPAPNSSGIGHAVRNVRLVPQPRLWPMSSGDFRAFNCALDLAPAPMFHRKAHCVGWR